MKNGLLSLPQYAAHFLRDPLHRNSFFLMASTGYMAVIGFLFWIIASHFYTPEAVGLAGSLISISGLLISLGTLGFPATLIRFLKTSTKQQQKINTSFTLASITALGLAAAFWVVSQFVVPELHALIASPVFFIFFALALLAAVWSQIFGAIFVAYREAHWVLLESLIFSTNKVIFIFFAISLGAMGLFLSNFGTLIIAVMIDVMILFFWYKMPFSFSIDRVILEEVWKYAAGSFVIQLVTMMPPQVLPAFITSQLGAKEAGFFYLAYNIIAALTIIPMASGQSLFAEASYVATEFRKLALKSIKSQIILVSLAVIGIWISANWLLSWFGKSYAADVPNLVRILSLSLFPMIITNAFAVRLKVVKRIKVLSLITILGAVFILFGCALGVRYGVNGVAIGFLIGQILTAITFVLHWKKESSF